MHDALQHPESVWNALKHPDMFREELVAELIAVAQQALIKRLQMRLERSRPGRDTQWLSAAIEQYDTMSKLHKALQQLQAYPPFPSGDAFCHNLQFIASLQAMTTTNFMHAHLLTFCQHCPWQFIRLQACVRLQAIQKKSMSLSVALERQQLCCEETPRCS